MIIVDTLLAPLEAGLSSVLVTAHAALVGAGLPAASGVTWSASIAVLVLAVRLALLPLVLRQVRASRRLAAAAPALEDIRRRYRGARDPQALARMRAETAQAYTEAGATPLGGLTLLVQMPVFMALFRLLDAAARGHAVGALGPALVAQLDGATLAGASLTQTLLAGGPAAVVGAGLVAVVAACVWLAQHHQLTRNTPEAALGGPAGAVQRGLRWFGPLMAAASGLVLPLGLLVYLACTNTISLVQQLAVVRVLPTPGSPAATA